MATDDVKRKLTAILSADVKGYSRLMADDEAATVRTIKAYRDVMTGLVKDHRGRVVDAKGDNVLADFSSVVDAVSCAVAVQKELTARNAELPEQRRMEFRIGINLGDVIEEEGTIYGDGVNVAARLEGLAEGGGICISGTAFDHVENKLRLEFEYLGEQAVKNIKKPVRLYRVRMEGGGSEIEEGKELPLPDKPSIAVLPFVNMSGDPEQEYFSDGMSEDIITALSQIPHMFVIARNSSFTYKDKPVNVRQVGRELGVRYVLEGSIRKMDARVRITAQLIDATSGHHLWSERYDRDLKDIFAVQDEITIRIMTAIGVQLEDGEQARSQYEGINNLDVFLKLLKAKHYFYRMNKEGNVLARQKTEEAIAIDPDTPVAYVLIGLSHVMDLWFGSIMQPLMSLEKATEAAQKAVILDDRNSDAHMLMGNIFIMRKEYEKAIAEAKRAIALNPNSANAYCSLGYLLHLSDRPVEAIGYFKKAIRLNPFPPSFYLHQLGHAYRAAGQYEEAIKTYEKSLKIEPNNIFAHIGLAGTYSLAGRERDAREASLEVLKIDPDFSLENFARAATFKDQDKLKGYIEALRKAGLK